MKRTMRILALLVAIVLLTSSTVYASGDTTVQPRYTYIASMAAKLSINTYTGVAHCYGKVLASSLRPAKVLVNLQRKIGNNWETIKSWMVTANTAAIVSEYYCLASGYEYRVEVVGFVYDSNNNALLETARAYQIQMYP